uniref:Uncharacterized protein n=1 Tax=Glycine max TaxID=3847 RepID=A0A0R0HNZ4_SOYBN
MGRAPCCEKMGLKKGLWTQEEDLILIHHINTHGHKNWRALPKQAGLLRCGKSCRLRWINYLKPDIKRGNFTREEEDMVIQLHETLGNRWSAIAAKFPGRTDNEIKNQKLSSLDTLNSKQQPVNLPTEEKKPLSPPQCVSSSMSTLTTSSDTTTNEHNSNHHHVPMMNNSTTAPESLDDDFWSQVLSADNNNSDATTSFPATGAAADGKFQGVHPSSVYNNVDYWFDVYMGAQEFPKF